MGDRAPYVAVINLALMTAQHWRTIRLKLIQSGIHDPMRLTSMHILLDTTEQLILDSMVSNKPEEDKRQRQDFLNILYRPVVKKGELPPPPPGFEDEGEGSFDQFLAAVSR